MGEAKKVAERFPGGDTPFIPASDAWRALPQGHKATRFINPEGIDQTRPLAVETLACSWDTFVVATDKNIGPQDRREFLRDMIAGANHDLRALGIGPLISMQEVESAAIGWTVMRLSKTIAG